MPDHTIISGLHKCQPKNIPKEGDVKTFAVINMPAKGGKKAWIRIKGEPPDKGGIPYRVVAVTPTGWEPDEYGNVALNLDVELAQNGQQTPQNAPQRAFTSNGGEDRSNRIERQHSQEMAIRYFALTETAVPTTTQLREMISWFQRDIGHPPTDGDHKPFPHENEEQEEIDF